MEKPRTKEPASNHSQPRALPVTACCSKPRTPKKSRHQHDRPHHQGGASMLRAHTVKSVARVRGHTVFPWYQPVTMHRAFANRGLERQRPLHLSHRASALVSRDGATPATCRTAVAFSRPIDKPPTPDPPDRAAISRGEHQARRAASPHRLARQTQTEEQLPARDTPAHEPPRRHNLVREPQQHEEGSNKHVPLRSVDPGDRFDVGNVFPANAPRRTHFRQIGAGVEETAARLYIKRTRRLGRACGPGETTGRLVRPLGERTRWSRTFWHRSWNDMPGHRHPVEGRRETSSNAQRTVSGVKTSAEREVVS